MPARDSVGVLARPPVGAPDWTRAEVTETGSAHAVTVTINWSSEESRA